MSSVLGTLVKVSYTSLQHDTGCNTLSCVYQKSAEDDVSGRTLAWEPGRLTLTLFGIRSIEQLLPFFTVLSQVFSRKSGIRSASFHSNTPPSDAPDAPNVVKNSKHESQKMFWSRARHDIEEMVEKDFLEGLIKTWLNPKHVTVNNGSTVGNTNTSTFRLNQKGIKYSTRNVCIWVFFLFIIVFFSKAFII